MKGQSDQEKQLFRELQCLIHEAIKALEISKEADDYEDYVQEAQLEVLRLIRLEQGVEPLEFERFKSRHSHNIVWHLKDIQRKKWQEQARVSPLEEESEGMLDQKLVDNAELVSINQSFFEGVTAMEKYLVLRRINDQASLFQIARELGRSKIAIYDDRQRILQKVQKNYREFLKGF